MACGRHCIVPPGLFFIDCDQPPLRGQQSEYLRVCRRILISMFPSQRRPAVYRGERGEVLFSLVTFSILVGSISIAIWAFVHMTWYVSLFVLVVAFAATAFIIKRFLFIIVGFPSTPITAAIGLVVLQYFAWFSSQSTNVKWFQDGANDIAFRVPPARSPQRLRNWLRCAPRRTLT